MFKSARLKLTLWYFLIISFILLLFSVLIYQVGSKLLFENLSRLQFRFKAEELNVTVPPRLPKDLRESNIGPIDFKTEEFAQDFAFAKERLLFSLLYIDLGILAVTTFLAYLLAGKTLAPIEASLLAQKRFTANAAHELRTPLTAIKTAIEVNLKDKKISKEEALNILQDNLKDIGDLEKLSNDLLLLSKVECREQKLHLRTIALDEILDELLHKFAPLAQNKNIKLIGQAKHDLVKTDYDKLMQILTILLDNAIKYTPKAGQVTLHFFMDKNKAVFQVKDNGNGISKENLPFIFDRFYKVEASRNKIESAGFGLGLAIAHETATLLHADLRVSSQLNKGSTFGLHLC